jgi:N-acetylneuraminate synthase/N,N'-diacetyllegionaminate synthase
MVIRFISISGRRIGPNYPCFVIAEAGVNHNGKVELAQRLIDAAAFAGADAVKFQTFKASRLVAPYAPKAEYQLKTTPANQSQYQMLRSLELSNEAHRELASYCSQKGIIFLSTPFDEQSCDLLEDIGVAAYKIPSGELNNLPFLRYVAEKGKPMIVSTGMACLGEVESALNAIEETGNKEVIPLHCVSNYPAEPRDINLRAMQTMANAFDLPVGYSDHSLGLEVSFAAVALGASVIEKHLTLNRSLSGPDHPSSIEPYELANLVLGIRKVESCLGNGRKRPATCEASTAAMSRKSLVAARDILSGEKVTDDMITAMRPGTGLPPSMKIYLMGRTAKVNITAGSLMDLAMVF